MTRTRIKICGTTSLRDAALARDAGADAIGLIFAPSKRQVTPAVARDISLEVGPGVARVGVFVVGQGGHTLDEVLRAADAARLSAVQLHGVPEIGVPEIGASGTAALPPLYLSAVLRYYPVLRVLRPGDAWPQARPGLSVLLDAPTPGSGVPLDWHALRGRFPNGELPPGAWLAGGLNPQNVAEAMAALRPAGVDAVSALEAQPGVKDPMKVRAFVKAIRTAERDRENE